MERVLAHVRFNLLALERFLDSSPDELASVDPATADSMLFTLLGGASFQPFDGAIRGGDLSLLGEAAIRWALNRWLGLSGDVVEDVPLQNGRREDLEDIVSLNALANVALPDWDESSLTDAASQSRSQVLSEWRGDERILQALLAKAR